MSERMAVLWAGTWRKSTYSDASGGSCVAAASSAGVVLVRDTADRDGGTLVFIADAWHVVTTGLRGLAPRTARSGSIAWSGPIAREIGLRLH